MSLRTIRRNGAALLILLAALPALADTRFQIRRMTRNDVPAGKGQCDIRLQVDDQVEVSVHLDQVAIRTISGRDAYDDGSECNAPLPNRDVPGFRFEVMDSRNEIRLVAEPSPRNNGTAVIFIRDSSGGFGRYHFRLSWEMAPGEYRPDGRRDNAGRPDSDERRGPPGFSWNNVVSFQGRGRGVARLNNFEDRLLDCNVDIDRGGKVAVVFRTERGRSMVFNGFLTADEGRRLKADMVTEDRRLRGTMFLSVDDRRNINNITLDAGDSRDRLSVTWDRR